MAAAPSSLLHSAEQEVFTGLTQAARAVRGAVPFAAGGSLGRQEVLLAVESDTTAGERRRADIFRLGPEGGEGELQELLAGMPPAKLGKGLETGAAAAANRAG